jgi:hypothetical protein
MRGLLASVRRVSENEAHESYYPDSWDHCGFPRSQRRRFRAPNNGKGAAILTAFDDKQGAISFLNTDAVKIVLASRANIDQWFHKGSRNVRVGPLMVWDSLVYLIPLSVQMGPAFFIDRIGKEDPPLPQMGPRYMSGIETWGRSTSCGWWWCGGSAGARWRRRNGAAKVVAQARCGAPLMRLRRAPLRGRRIQAASPPRQTAKTNCQHDVSARSRRRSDGGCRRGVGEMISSFLIGCPSLLASSGETLRSDGIR